MTTTYRVICATCSGDIRFIDDDPTRPVCAGCSLRADLCTCRLKARIAKGLERVGREMLTELIFTTDPEEVAHQIVLAMDR